jgi:ARMET, C-terminal
VCAASTPTAVEDMYAAVRSLNSVVVLQAVKITPQTDFSRLKVGQLKELLRDRGILCRDCFEKSDFIGKLRELAVAQA